MTLEEIEIKLKEADKERSEQWKIAMEMPSWQECEAHLEPYNKKVSLLSREARLLRTPVMEELPDYAHLMTMKDFVECCECGGFIDYDGSGNYSDGDMQANIGISPSDVTAGKYRKDFSHVAWYNR